MISKRIDTKLASGSMIRKMFEEGNRLKGIYGADKVYDFSIGNPDLEPPQSVIDTISELAASPILGKHAYMSNNGYLSTREAVANYLSARSTAKISSDGVCMTVGAAGGMNAILCSILDPLDEVILIAPFFMEYTSYIENFMGVPVIVPALPDTFMPDLAAIEAAITDKTKAIIINSPNNPTGAVYPPEVLSQINTLLLAQNHLIHIISDEPYVDLIYDGATTPTSLDYFTNLIICYSWSKSLSLPGERIGYTAVNSSHEDYAKLSPAIIMCNRILGSVNAPAFFQKVVEKNLYARADISSYEHRRNLLYEIVTQAGFTCQKPGGALYLFPKAPVDDLSFASECAKHNLLLVPGSAFYCPGHFRLAFCVSEKTILGSEEAFFEVGKKYGLR